MQRALVMLIAVVCYFAFFFSFVYLVGFVAGYPGLPTHVDKGLAAPPAVAAVIDLGLIALFGLQHSVMARPGFKARWPVPAALERSVFCLATAVVLSVLFAVWHPLTGTVWSVADPLARMALWGLFAAGFAIVFVSTWLINHFELFGLAQAWNHARGHAPQPIVFRTPLFYRLVRHPIYLGFLLAFWATPDMSAGHLLLALGFTLYILIGIRYEERDLIAHFGETYAGYRARVGMVLPWLGRG
jgi:protein-S-isoprenylcysteine O-methyltransferase Ste14